MISFLSFKQPLIYGLLALTIFLAAFIPRAVDINAYDTPDQILWVIRSEKFHEALTKLKFKETAVAPHPGVVTLWLGAIDIWLTPNYATLSLAEKFFLFRSSSALFISFSLALIFLLLIKVFQNTFIAATASLFLALDPTLVALSRVFLFEHRESGLILTE